MTVPFKAYAATQMAPTPVYVNQGTVEMVSIAQVTRSNSNVMYLPCVN